MSVVLDFVLSGSGCPISRVFCEKWGFGNPHTDMKSMRASGELQRPNQNPHFSQRTREMGHPVTHWERNRPRCDTRQSATTLQLPAQRRPYPALMKNLQVLSPLFTSLLLASMALAQAGGLPDAPRPQDSASTDVQLTEIQATQAPNPTSQESGENKIISQAAPFPRVPRGPMPARGRAYPSAFAPHPPALSPLGALIGFGAGAALGATASGDQTSRGRVAGALIGGSLCALIGGAIGHAFSAVDHNFHDRHDWDNAQERKHGKQVPRPLQPDVDASSTPALAQPAGSL